MLFLQASRGTAARYKNQGSSRHKLRRCKAKADYKYIPGVSIIQKHASAFTLVLIKQTWHPCMDATFVSVDSECESECVYDAHEVGALEGSATNEAAVNVGLGKEFGCVGGLAAAAV